MKSKARGEPGHFRPSRACRVARTPANRARETRPPPNSDFSAYHDLCFSRRQCRAVPDEASASRTAGPRPPDRRAWPATGERGAFRENQTRVVIASEAWRSSDRGSAERVRGACNIGEGPSAREQAGVTTSGSPRFARDDGGGPFGPNTEGSGSPAPEARTGRSRRGVEISLAAAVVSYAPNFAAPPMIAAPPKRPSRPWARAAALGGPRSLAQQPSTPARKSRLLPRRAHSASRAAVNGGFARGLALNRQRMQASTSAVRSHRLSGRSRCGSPRTMFRHERRGAQSGVDGRLTT